MEVKRKMRKTITLLTAILLASGIMMSLTGCALSGALFGEKGYMKNHVYLLDEQSYERVANENYSQYDKPSTLGSEGNIPSPSQLVIEQVYYLIGYTEVFNPREEELVCEDGQLSIQLVPEEGEEELTASINDAVEILSVAVKGDIEVNEFSNNPGEREYRIRTDTSQESARFSVVVQFKMRMKVGLRFVYNPFNPYALDMPFGFDNILPAERSTTTINPARLALNSLHIGYLMSEHYTDGRYDPANLVDSINMEVGKKYYLVISASLYAQLDKGDSETVTLSFKLSPSSIMGGTLESATTGEFSENISDSDKEITVPIRFPESGTKTVELLFKLTPVEAGTAIFDPSYATNMNDLRGEWERLDTPIQFTVNAGDAGGYRVTVGE